MNEAQQGVPAQRVINSKGELSSNCTFHTPGGMCRLLEEEGIIFSSEGRVDLKRYGWDLSRDLSVEELSHILDTADTNVAVNQRLVDLMRNGTASLLCKPS